MKDQPQLEVNVEEEDRYGLTRLSSKRQVKERPLTKQGKELVDRARVPPENILGIVASGKPRRDRKRPLGPSRKDRPQAQEQTRQHLETLPGGSVLVVVSPSRFSRDYHWCVSVLNEFYRRGCRIAILTWKRSPLFPEALELNTPDLLHKFYNEVYLAQQNALQTERAAKQGIARSNKIPRGAARKLSPVQEGSLKEECMSTPFERGKTIPLLMKKFDISRPTLWRYLKRY